MTTEGKLKRSRNPLDFDFTEPEALTRYVTETGKILQADRPHRPPAASYCQGR
jgi:ribosomal protein S18